MKSLPRDHSETRDRAVLIAQGAEVQRETAIRSALILGVPRRTLKEWRRDGSGPEFVRLEKRRVGYWRADLVEWLIGRGSASSEGGGS